MIICATENELCLLHADAHQLNTGNGSFDIDIIRIAIRPLACKLLDCNFNSCWIDKC